MNSSSTNHSTEDLDLVIDQFSKVSIHKMTTTDEQLNLVLQKLQNLELVYEKQSKELNEKSKKLDKIEDFLRREYENKPLPALEEAYEDELPSNFLNANLCIKVIEALPTFQGNIANYQTWKSQVTMTFKKFEGREGTENYWDALCLFRSKVVGEASNILTAHNTKMNFKAILRRLDLTYGNRKPIEVLEFELFNLKQDNLSLCQYFQLISEKRTEIVNKYLDVYGMNSDFYKVMSIKTGENAHRTFISGLQRNIRDHVVDRKTRTLEDAYAEAQIVLNEFEEARYSYEKGNNLRSFSKQRLLENPRRNENFEQRYIRSRYQMQLDQNPQNNPSTTNQHFQQIGSKIQRSQPTPMEVDPSISQNISKSANNQHFQQQQPAKRFYGSTQQSYQPQFKNMKINNIDQTEYKDLNEEQYDNNDFEIEEVSDELDVNLLNESFLRVHDSLIYIYQTNEHTNKVIKILIDTGATGNFCREDSFDSSKYKLPQSLKINSIHGCSLVTEYYKVNLEGHKLNFLILPNLKEDAILGLPGICQMKMKIFGEDNSVHYKKNPVPSTQEINYIIADETEDKYKQEIDLLMKTSLSLGDHIPFTTNVVAKIETIDDSPIYKKPIPLPPASNHIIRLEIDKLLKLGIIRPSISPYNAPAFLVPKHDSKGNKTGDRMVIDYRYLNLVTKEFKFGMPNTSVILSNLGKSKYFTTLDIESGFHHILLREQDREKTAFSTNTGKFEFNRLPFGLKNAPSIFQSTINNILEELIGGICHVYIDDVLIFSETKEQHMKDIQRVIEKLTNANMKISSKKSKFFMRETEFLGYKVSYCSLKMDESKIKAVRDYPEPKTLKELRAFLGLSGYYRKFVKKYAEITKPLTVLLRNHNDANNSKSSRIKIRFDENAKKAFKIIKDKLEEQVELYQPDYNRPFTLTTDASNVAIGAVLSQENKPVAFISRTLSSTEQNYATNEKEMLAIVWSLQSLRNYLYGHSGFKIYTDHQPLTFAISDKNSNLKLKRWKAFIEEFSPKLIYKPGKENIVADALSRHCNSLTNKNMELSDKNIQAISTAATRHSQEESSNPLNFPRTSVPINTFKQQIIIERSTYCGVQRENTFQGYTRHLLFYNTKRNLTKYLKQVVSPNLMNAIHTIGENVPTLDKILFEEYPTTKFIFSTKFVKDILDYQAEEPLIERIHSRAHRGVKENYKRIIETHFFPKMKDKIKKFIEKCRICKTAKYERHPKQQKIGETPIPKFAGEIIQMDLFFANNNTFITMIDKFSKYLLIKKIPNKKQMSLQILELLNHFPKAEKLITDNESGFVSAATEEILRLRSIEHFTTTPQHSTSNAQIERVHSTILELVRCLQQEKEIIDYDILIMEAVKEYNETIHSVTKAKPYDVFHRQTDFENIPILLKQEQDKMLDYQNKFRIDKNVSVNQEIFVKTNCRNKLAPRYKQEQVKVVKNNTVVIKNKNKEIHKDNIKSS